MGGQTRYLFVYACNDAEVRPFLVSEDLDPTDLKYLICMEFGLPAQEPICFEHYDSQHSRNIIIPLTAIKSFAFSSRDYEIAVRLKSYSTPGVMQQHQQQQQIGGLDPWENARYFGEYGKVNIHWHMLKDKRRCESYHRAVETFAVDFKDKIVLDVGCGTSILSCFAARAGAKKVYAIEASGMYKHAQDIVKQNGLDEIVEVIHGRVEEIELPVQQVDIIISEWMGIFLLFESMLDSVLFARDKWLAPDGQLFPAKARMFLAPICLDDWWEPRVQLFEKGVCGINLTPLLETACEQFSEVPLKGFPDVKPHHIIGDAAIMKEIDIKTVTLEEIREFEYDFSFDLSKYHQLDLEGEIEQDGFVYKKKKDHIHGFVTWFDVTFESHAGPEAGTVVLSTSPFESPATHWQQDCFIMGEKISIEGINEIHGTLRAHQHRQWRRHYEVCIGVSVGSNHFEKEFVL